MQTIDPNRAKWMELGAPAHEVDGVFEIVEEAIYLMIFCSSGLRKVIFDFAIADDELLTAYHAPSTTELERTWLRRLGVLSLKDRASAMAAFEGFWSLSPSTFGRRAA